MSSILIQVVILVAEEKRGLRMGGEFNGGFGGKFSGSASSDGWIRENNEGDNNEDQSFVFRGRRGGFGDSSREKVGFLVVVVEVKEGLVDVTMG